MIGLKNKTLHSSHLSYRLLTASDKAALHELLSDPSVTQPAGYMPAGSRAEFNTFFNQLTLNNTGIVILLDHTLIGYIHVFKYSPEAPQYAGTHCASVGFVIGKPYQNHGYGTEALAAITKYLKQSFDYCFAAHFADNEPSKRVIQKCGYRYFEEYTMFFPELNLDITCLGYVY